jgi:predicted metal-binding membrane protein
MLVMFALKGGLHLPWMLALTAFMVAEKTTPVGKQLGWALGVVLIVAALLTLMS